MYRSGAANVLRFAVFAFAVKAPKLFADGSNKCLSLLGFEVAG